MADYNHRFAVPAAEPTDAHRLVLHTHEELAIIFTLHYPRKFSNNLSFQFHHYTYHILDKGQSCRLRGAIVAACQAVHGTFQIFY